MLIVLQHHVFHSLARGRVAIGVIVSPMLKSIVGVAKVCILFAPQTHAFTEPPNTARTCQKVEVCINEILIVNWFLDYSLAV